MNRVKEFLPESDCPHCAAESKLAELRVEIDRIESVMGQDVVQFCIPAVDDFARALQVEPGRKPKQWSMPRLHLEVRFRSSEMDEDLAAYALREIKRLRRALRKAQRKLESGVSE